MKLKVGELPAELLTRPSAFVAFSGLDVTNNAIHKAIWESFSLNRRADRVPIEFKLINESHEFPPAKQKRTSYEWYVPKGLLKTNWMNKHLNEIPALHVLYVDLDWDHPQWNEGMHRCAQRVQTLRNHLIGRNTKVAVVLIQRNTMPPGEDMLAAGHAANLCSACDLTAKSLFVLPHSDHLPGYVTRLEMAFHELVKGYYGHEARAIKAHQDFLSKTTHHLLFVRHQFKMGFLNEMKQDGTSALKHYKQAYTNLMEVRMSDTNLLEIKTVAGFINYKICKLSFLNMPLEAISQFRKHIDTFKLREGCRDLQFEHAAWISKQYEFFGDLFNEAVKQELAAVQTQHPGFYYQQAAHYATVRKEICQRLSKNAILYPSKDPLISEDTMEFYGQRPWRPGNQNLEPPDPQKEKDGIAALQHREITLINHSKLIIPLLSNAVSHFKKHRCPRMKRQLMVLMGKEYFHNQEYNRALVLLSKVSWDYRSEKWWALLTNIQHTALKCAYLCCNVQEYVMIALEMIGEHLEYDVEEKTRIQTNMLRVIQNKIPEPESDCVSKCVDKAKVLWEQSTNSKPQLFTIELNNINSFVDCFASFSKNEYFADELVQVTVGIRVFSPLPIEFEKLSISFSNKAYNDHCILSKENCSDKNSLYFVPLEPKTFEFSFVALEKDVNDNIQINSIMLQLGSELTHSAVLYWSVSGNCSPQNFPFPQSRFLGDTKKFSPVDSSSLSKILPRESKAMLKVEHNNPALCKEFYPIRIVLQNNETNIITDVILNITLIPDSTQTNLTQNTHLSVEASFDGNVSSVVDAINIPDLPPGKDSVNIVYLKSLSNETREFKIEVSYKMQTSIGDQVIVCNCEKTDCVMIDTIDPFHFSFQVLDTKFSDLKFVSTEEPFVFKPNIKCLSSWPIVIETSYFGLSKHVDFVEEFESQLNDVKLKNEDEACECMCLISPLAETMPIPLGEYTIQWKRENPIESIPFVQTTVVLPSITVKTANVFIETEIPSRGTVRSALPVMYTIHNRTDSVQEIELFMDSSEAFMFSGHKQNRFKILPRGFEKLSFNFYPLLCGYVQLPRMRFKLNPGTVMPISLDNEIQKMVPSHVYIMPKGKNIQTEDCKAMLLVQ